MLESFTPFADGDELQKLLSQPEVADGGDETEVNTPEATKSLRLNALPQAGILDRRSAPPTVLAPERNRRKMIWIAVAGLITVAAAISIMALIFRTTNGSSNSSSIISSGGFLEPGRSITSANGQFIVIMQRDGNLVDYTKVSKHVLWESDTSGSFNSYVVMQADGNFVIYPPGKSAPAPGHPTSALWDSGTSGHPGAYAEILNSGNLAVRSSNGKTDLWKARISSEP